MSLSKKLFIAAVAASAAVGVAGSSVKADDYYRAKNVTKIGSQTNIGNNYEGAAGSSSGSPLDPGSFALGMTAPTADVGSKDISKGTVSFSSSVGTSDQFAVGTNSSMAASANISATPDYNAKADASFQVGVGANIQQTIGQGVDVAAGLIGGTGGGISGVGVGKGFSANDGTIGGSFKKIESPGAGIAASNEVDVNGIGSNADIAIGNDASFTTSIKKDATPPTGDALVSAGTASGGASGTVNTSTSASASSSQFVSSFAQAY